MKKVWFLILTLVLYYPVFAQQSGYNISIYLPGYNSNTAYLGNYFGDKMAISDTSKVVQGNVTFKGEDQLKQGVYFLVTADKKKAFEFMIGDDQHFGIEKNLSAPAHEVRFEGSDENDIFYNYLNYNKQSYDQVMAIRASMQNLEPGNDSLKFLQDEVERINVEGISYKLDIIDKYPGSVTAMLFNVMREPEVPEFFLPDGRQDSNAAYLYYRNHYWEYVDLSDDRFLRTPVFHRKLERYMNKVVPGHPDTLIREIDNMIARTTENSEMQHYLLWYFTNTYETSKVMGYDKIFVHMVDTYFTDKGYEWLHPTVQKNMIDRVNQLRNVLIGSYAPALVMGDTAQQFISLHQIEADYTVILFWSSTCAECRQEVEILDNFLDNTEIDMEIYGVNTDTSFSKWAEYLLEHDLSWVNVNGNLNLTGDYHQLYDIYSTPVIYVLDDQKTIIAKRIAAAKVPSVIERHKLKKRTKVN
jgi:thiol-disulfide isomerase/thioredoxin